MRWVKRTWAAAAAVIVGVALGCSTPQPPSCCFAHADSGSLSAICACGSTQGSLACTVATTGSTCTVTCMSNGATVVASGSVVQVCPDAG